LELDPIKAIAQSKDCNRPNLNSHRKNAIAQSKDCDCPNPSGNRKTAIAPHVLEQNKAIAISKYFMASMI
jgi:hypothetical protein